MISKSPETKEFCREPLSNVENYDVAVSSPDMYELHHRDEIKILPSGIEVRRSRKEMKENGRYYQCPANELIFLPQTEHKQLHAKGQGWKGDDASERTKRRRGRPYLSHEAKKLRRLKRKQRNAERVQAIQETKGVL